MTSDRRWETTAYRRWRLLLPCLAVSTAALGCIAPAQPGARRASDSQNDLTRASSAAAVDPHHPAAKHTTAAVSTVAFSEPVAVPVSPGQVPGTAAQPTVEQAAPFAAALAEPVAAPSEQSAAASPQPVEYFIAVALQGHPRIAAMRQRVAAAVQEIPQARALADPMLGNTFWPITDQALQTAGGRIAHQATLSQQVPWPEKLSARAAVAQREVDIARAELARVERDIAEAVRLAYYELWFSERAIEIVEDNRNLVEDLIAVAETRYRTGGSQQDVLRAQLEGEKLEDQLITLRRQKAMAQADLAALVQQPLALAPEPMQELDLPDEPAQLDALVAAALQCNPELRGLAWQIARDRERQRLACLARYPDFQLGVGWSLVTEDDALSPVANGHDNINFSLGMTLPVWRDKINAGIREAAANTAATARMRDAEEDELYGMLRRLLAEAEASLQQLELYRSRIIPRTERTLQLATADYRGERLDFYSLIDLYQELLMYQLQVARIEATLAGTLAQLDRAVGCPVPLVPSLSDAP